MIEAPQTPTRAGTELIPFEPRHIDATYDWVTNPQLRHDFLLRGEITPEGHRQYFAKLLTDQTQALYAITFAGTHVGNCGFKHLDPIRRRAELWIYLGSYQHHGKGIGNSATSLLIEKGFGELSLELIYLHVAEFNEKAVALYQRSGFQVTPCDGCLEWGDRSIKILHMELPADRWRALCPKGNP
ncbi:GNAT family N-acetyltransferase [Geomesophilobacter sediminis]|uniref:GNAT family N-acetyltransferase n=1 Tax=Geomesophilobacter sediminis TaxID=2798584 RepID=A0A8J7LYI0_9BACT|nr:GNAT family N-acetyltransferase [Geomesophilobacter sediminis]MBJ6724837.1 GNAT family N-acetyltransferase [Geomesophilobacter sediminis]